MNKRYRCPAGRHWYNSEDAADRCHLCRRTVDLKVRRYFKRQSEELLNKEKNPK